MAIQRTAVNPVDWSLEMGFNQGEVVTGETRTLYCSGQTAMGPYPRFMDTGCDYAAGCSVTVELVSKVSGEV